MLIPLEIIAQLLVKANSLLLHTSRENIYREFFKGHHGKECRSRQSSGPVFALACWGENVTELTALGVQNAVEWSISQYYYLWSSEMTILWISKKSLQNLKYLWFISSFARVQRSIFTSEWLSVVSWAILLSHLEVTNSQRQWEDLRILNCHFFFTFIWLWHRHNLIKPKSWGEEWMRGGRVQTQNVVFLRGIVSLQLDSPQLFPQHISHKSLRLLSHFLDSFSNCSYFQNFLSLSL